MDYPNWGEVPLTYLEAIQQFMSVAFLKKQVIFHISEKPWMGSPPQFDSL